MLFWAFLLVCSYRGFGPDGNDDRTRQLDMVRRRERAVRDRKNNVMTRIRRAEASGHPLGAEEKEELTRQENEFEAQLEMLRQEQQRLIEEMRHTRPRSDPLAERARRIREAISKHDFSDPVFAEMSDHDL